MSKTAEDLIRIRIYIFRSILHMYLHNTLQEFIKLAEFEEKGSITEKLTWAFKVYDKDKSGLILF